MHLLKSFKGDEIHFTAIRNSTGKKILINIYQFAWILGATNWKARQVFKTPND